MCTSELVHVPPLLFLPNILVTSAKEIVHDPATFMDAELDGLLRRLATTDGSKWAALRELGLDAQVPAQRERRRRR